MRPLLRGLAALLIAVPVIAVAVVSAPPAGAQDNGLGLTPLLGWSSWSFIRRTPTAAKIKAQADAMMGSGLKDVGYQNVNVDDFWYQCPGSQGPNVDEFGRWVIDGTAFPPSGSRNGIQAVADYVHSKGLKFGLYATPGISKQAVAQNSAIEGTPYHAADIATTASENNYNCRGMLRPASCPRPAGVSPVRVDTGVPGSRPRFVGEIWRAERGVESLFGGSKIAGRSAIKRESCSLVKFTKVEPSRSCHGEGHVRRASFRGQFGGSARGTGSGT